MSKVTGKTEVQMELLEEGLLLEKELTSYEKLKNAFETFDEENPEIYRLILMYVGQLKKAGHKKYGISGIFERIRWHKAVETTDPEFKLSNNHRAFYARKVMEDYPEHEGFFVIKEQTSNR